MATSLPPAPAFAARRLAPDGARITLPPPVHRTLHAAVARIVPDADADALTARVIDWLATQPRDRIDEAVRGLALFGSRGAALASVGRAVPFAALDTARQDRMLLAWGASPLAPCRTLFQLVRRLALLAQWSDDTVTPAIGYDGPLWSRAPRRAWEGPAAAHTHPDADEPALDEPVRRVGDPWERSPRFARPGAVHTAATLRGTVRLTADAIVIGTGAGGAVAAARLAEGGKEVVVLESGEWLRGDDFDERDGPALRRLYAGSGLQATDDLAVAMLQGRAVGGSTTVNWMMMLRTPDHVLDEWGRRFGIEGIDAATMAPVFARIEDEVHARRVPSDAHSRNNALLLAGARALGWRHEEARINARGCVRAGFCGHGCRYDAKQGTMQVYIPRALGAGARLFADAHAECIERRERGTARPRSRVHAVVRDPHSGAVVATIEAEAPVVILAGGAVQTPVLLEKSGLGGGGVGEYLRLHPTTAVVGVHDDDVRGAAGLPMTVHVDEFERPPSGYGFWIQCPPLHPALGAVALPGFGEAHAALMRRFASLSSFLALTRDGADPVASSGGVHVDRRGRTRLRYALTAADAATVREGVVAAARLQLAAGAREAITLHADPVIVRSERDLAAIRTRSLAANRVALFSAHVNGTCRIGTDPRTSGCTPTGERHGVPGLYVLDGSLLPTGVGVNPQETIMALVTVLTDRLLAGWRDA